MITGIDNDIRGCGPLKQFWSPARPGAPQQTLVKGEGTSRCDEEKGHTKFEVVLLAESTDDRYDKVRANIAMYNQDDDVIEFTRQTCTTQESGTICIIGVKLRFWSQDEYHLFQAEGASLRNTEGTISPTQYQFNSFNWDQPQNMTITGVNDDVADGDQTFTIQFTGKVTYKHHSLTMPLGNADNNCQLDSDCDAGVAAGGVASCVGGNCQKQVKAVSGVV